MDHLTLYKSSAGSGKTTVLTREYLKLALKKNFRNILAVTFTNKATNELKDRVVKNLYAYSKSTESPLAKELCNELGLEEKEFQSRCKSALDSILNTYGAFSISTIDAFFQRIIRSFAREAGIQGNFKLEIDHELILDEGVKRLLSEAGKNPTLTRWLIRFSHEAAEQGASSDLTTKIQNLGKEVFKEKFAAIQQVVAKEGTIDRFEELERQLYQITSEFSGKLSASGTLIFEKMREHSIGEKDLKNGIWTQLNNLYNGEIPKFNLAVFGAAMNGKEYWYTQKSTLKRQIETAVEDGVLDELHRIRQFIEENSTHFYTAQIILDDLYAFGIISDLLTKIDSHKIENDILLLSDSSAFLAKIIEGFDSPFIYEKVGSRYQHFLIDEFQDTSLYQWNNFRPLLENSLAEGEGSVIVGDVKQSIYRWRGGDWDLLGEQIEQQIQQTEVRSLTKNWRSKKKVVEFNNRFFADALNETATLFSMNASKLIESERVVEIEQRIRGIYTDLEQEITEQESEDEGYVKVQFLPGNEEDFTFNSLEEVPRIIEQLQAKGLKARDIAILVRKRQEGERVASHILAHSKSEKKVEGINYDVVSSEILRVANSASVNLLVAVLKWMNSPDDKISLLGFLSDYHTYFSEERVSNEELFTSFFAQKARELFPKDLSDELREISKLPIYELTEEIIRRFNLKDNPQEWPYLLGFQDEVLQFSSREAGDLATFLEWWDEHGWEWPVNISEDIDAIRIMTIHKAKGLEFEAVILPFCNWKMSPNKNDILWASTDIAPFNMFTYYPLRNNEGLARSYFSEYYLRELADTYIDNLNLLYVAFTRASQALFVLVPEHERSDSVSSILSNVFRLSKGQLLIETGTPEFEAVEEEDHEMGKIELKTFHSGNWNEKVRVATKELIKLREDVYQKVEMGLLLHDILSDLQHADKLAEKLDRYQLSGRLPLELREEVEEKITQLLEHPTIGKWFTEGNVLNEKSLLTGRGTIKRPDKVIVSTDSYTVVDFKNGAERPEHLEQVRDYMHILGQLDKKKVEGYVLYLQPFSLVPVNN